LKPSGTATFRPRGASHRSARRARISSRFSSSRTIVRVLGVEIDRAAGERPLEDAGVAEAGPVRRRLSRGDERLGEISPSTYDSVKRFEPTTSGVARPRRPARASEATRDDGAEHL
jgi:hypothetical protein